MVRRVLQNRLLCMRRLASEEVKHMLATELGSSELVVSDDSGQEITGEDGGWEVATEKVPSAIDGLDDL